MADLGYWTGGILWTPGPGGGAPTDLEFGALDANGTAWALLDWQGLGGVGTAGQVVQKSGDHGANATPQFYAARTLTLTVHATATSQAQRDVARAYLQQAIPVSELATFRLDEPVPVQMSVRRSGQIVETYVGLFDAEFSIPLVAPDPRKYSTVLHSVTATQASAAAGLAPPLRPPFTLPAGSPPMAVSCTNAGSFETRALVTITGPITGPAVVNQVTGQTVAFPGLILAATDVLAVDFLNKVALLNGVYRPADAFSSWWVMPPGTTGIRVIGTSATGSTMTVAWRDAWI